MKRRAQSGNKTISSKKLKTFEIRDKNLDKIPIEDRRLDSLARLFQETSQGCAAVCLINKTILIADNDIHAGTTSKNSKLALIQDTMQYFSDVANEHKEYVKSRQEVFRQICVSRLKGEEKGYIKLDDVILEKIANDVLNTYKINEQENWRTQYAKQIPNYEVGQRSYVATAYEIAALVIRDFLKIEEFINANKNSDKDDVTTDFIAALKGQKNTAIFVDQAGGIVDSRKGLVQNEERPGYIILSIDRPGVHAETKIVEYLVFTHVVHALEKDAKVYIGISKLCCKGCNKFIQAANKVFCNGYTVFTTRGTHGLQPYWKQPMICHGYQEERVFGYNYSEKTQKLVAVELGSEKTPNVMHKCIYIDVTQINELSTLVPYLPKAQTSTDVYQTVYPNSSIGSPSPSNSTDDREKLVNLSKATNRQVSKEFLKRFAFLLNRETRESIIESLNTVEKQKNINNLEEPSLKTVAIDTTWYDYLAIKDSLIIKGIDAENILKPAQNMDELNGILEQINKQNHIYMIPLNVNALDGSFTATNHWVGLYAITNEIGISSIKYINPIGQPINKQLEEQIFFMTEIKIIDLTAGKGVQFAYAKESEILELEGNTNDCGPMLVQLFYELFKYNEIRTHSLNQEESIQFGQRCRKKQKYKDHSEDIKTDNLGDSSEEAVTGNSLQDNTTKLFTNFENLEEGINLTGINNEESSDS